MRWILLALAFGPFLVSCAGSGVLLLGSYTLRDGSTVDYVQAKTNGHSGPDINVVESYHCGWPDNAVSNAGSTVTTTVMPTAPMAPMMPMVGGSGD